MTLQTVYPTELITLSDQKFQAFKEELKDVTMFWIDRANEEMLNLHIFRGFAMLAFKKKCEEEHEASLAKSFIIELSKDLGLDASPSTLYKEMRFAQKFGYCVYFDKDQQLDKLDLKTLQADAHCAMTWRAISSFGIRDHENMERKLIGSGANVVDYNTLQTMILDLKPYKVQFVSRDGAVKNEYIIEEFKDG